MERAIRRRDKQVCGACMSANCMLKQSISKRLKLHELQTNIGCKGSPKSTFADIRTQKVRAVDTRTSLPTETPQAMQASAASRTVSALLGELDEEEDNLANTAAGLRINMITIRLEELTGPLEELEKEESDPAASDPQRSTASMKLSAFLEELEEGEGDLSIWEPHQSTASMNVSAFLEEL